MKQTEIGLIPDDWEVKEFKQEATLINGRAYAQSELLKQGKYKVLRVGNFGTNDNWYYSNLELPEKQYCTQGDLLYCWSCTYGAYIWNEPNTIYHYHIWKIISKGADKEYLKYILNNDTENQMKSSNGSTMAHITKGFLENRLFAFPPLAEQQRIAKALSDVDALISTTEKLIQKKKDIKQGTMQNLLTGKKRLPGFAKSNKTKITEIGEIPEDWEIKTFGDYVYIVRGGSPRPIQNYLTMNSDGINWIKIGDVKPEDKYIVSTEEKIIPEGKSRSREVHKGDFILSNSMSFGRPYILQIDGCIHDGWLAIQNYQATFDSDFLYYLLGSDEIFQQYIEMAAGSSVQNLNKEKVAKLLLPIFDKKEQTAIASVLSSMDKEIEILNTKLEKYRNIKTAMMQQLLTGKIRLK